MSSSIDSLPQRIFDHLRSKMTLSPTLGQTSFLEHFSDFAANTETEIFVLKGYAGTGKTTMMATLCSAFERIILLAPTGRAAKVLSSYTQKPAYTIHRHLYQPTPTSDGKMMLRLNENRYKRTLFIVDESSMIADSSIADEKSNYPGVNLLTDLLSYIFSSVHCKVLFVGDIAQLPPVNFDESPALDFQHLKNRFARDIQSFELTEVVRQAADSGILKNATALRMLIKKKAIEPRLKVKGFNDVIILNPRDLPETLNDSYGKYGQDNVTVITRSNKNANQYNKLIRYQILWRDNELDAGDSLMVVKNNYYWLPEDYKSGFIANGDVIEIRRVKKFETKFGFDFAWVEVCLIDAEDDPPFEVCMLLNTITSEAPALKKEEADKLYKELENFYFEDGITKKDLRDYIRKDVYYNALQVKFSYSITCHKAQGGQWDIVFIDHGYTPEDINPIENLRWLYTAFTRAKTKLYLLNFDEKYFVD